MFLFILVNHRKVLQNPHRGWKALPELQPRTMSKSMVPVLPMEERTQRCEILIEGAHRDGHGIPWFWLWPRSAVISVQVRTLAYIFPMYSFGIDAYVDWVTILEGRVGSHFCTKLLQSRPKSEVISSRSFFSPSYRWKEGEHTDRRFRRQSAVDLQNKPTRDDNIQDLRFRSPQQWVAAERVIRKRR